MSVEIRAPRPDEWPAICHLDGRVFGSGYTPEEVEQLRPLHDLDRFRVAFDDGQAVATAGSYAMEVTLPGGCTVPMGGVTWVCTSATHRRQGLMRRTVEAVHQDIDQRGEPLATLYASEGGIYEHLGYGIATQTRGTSIDRRSARIRHELRGPVGAVRYADGEEVISMIADRWANFRRLRAGEVDCDEVSLRYQYERRRKPSGTQSAASYLMHAEGFATYRLEPDWAEGHPQHVMHLIEFAAVTPAAHLALWQSLLDVDLVGEIRSRILAVDDPLPYLLENQRALRTTNLNDGVWANVRDPSICFGARSYRSTDRLVVEAEGKRWSIDGGPDGGSCKAVKSKPDIVTSRAGLSSLLYGGVLPSALAAGRRMTARNDRVLVRADLFFAAAPAPHCQTAY